MYPVQTSNFVTWRCNVKVTNFNEHENSQNDALTIANLIVAIVMT